MRDVLRGSTDQSVVIRIIDATDGTPETGVEHNTSGIDLWYRREGEAKVSITEAALASADAAHSDGGIEHLGDGYYRVDLPDAAVASGAAGVLVGGTVTGMIVIGAYLHLTAYNPLDSVRLGLTALPNAAADAAGGLPISDAGGFDVDALAALLTRLSALRAGYLDNLSGGSVALNSDMSSLLSRLSLTRAGYLDNLNAGGVVASQADIVALNQSASRRILLTTVQQYERPESSSSSYTIEARTFDGDGAATNADSTPTLTATGATTGSLAANLSSATSPAAGVYRWTYTVASGATQEQIRFDVSATIGGSTFTLAAYSQVVDLVSSTWTTSDRTKLEALYNKLPSKSYLTGTANADGDVELNEATGTPANSAGVTSLLAMLGAFTGSGVNTVLGFLKAIMSKSASTPSDVGGTFSAATDAIEAIRDRGDAAWIPSGGDATLAKQEEILTAIGDLSGGTGSGAYTLTIQVTNGTTALQGAIVRLTEGVNVRTRTTNASGIVQIGVDAATWSVAITKDGYDFEPTTKVVTGSGSQTYAMTQQVITPPSSPALSTVTAQILTAAGAAVPKARVKVRITASPGGSGSICLGDYATYTADDDGVVEMELIKDATYQLQVVGYRGWNEFTPDTDTFEVPDIIAGT